MRCEHTKVRLCIVQLSCICLWTNGKRQQTRKERCWCTMSMSCAFCHMFKLKELTFFASYFFSFQGAGGTKYGVTAFGKVEHHSFSSFVPISVWFIRICSVPFLLWSRSQKWPTSQRESASIIRNRSRIRNTFYCVRFGFTITPRWASNWVWWRSVWFFLKISLCLSSVWAIRD